MSDFFRDCNKLALLLFVLMGFQTVTSVIAHAWGWVLIMGAFTALNAWQMLPPYTQAWVRARLPGKRP